MNQAGLPLPKVQPLSLLVYLPDSSWSSLMFISIFLEDGGGVKGSARCVGKDYLFTRSGCSTFANAVSGIGLSIYSAVPLLKYLPECLLNLTFFLLGCLPFLLRTWFPPLSGCIFPNSVFSFSHSLLDKTFLPPVDFLIAFFHH